MSSLRFVRVSGITTHLLNTRQYAVMIPGDNLPSILNLQRRVRLATAATDPACSSCTSCSSTGTTNVPIAAGVRDQRHGTPTLE
jgi:hypothetical protein